MTNPNWNIGPVARRRLTEMYKHGLQEQRLGCGPGWFAVEISASPERYPFNLSVFFGHGKTIGLAVEYAWRKWKATK